MHIKWFTCLINGYLLGLHNMSYVLQDYDSDPESSKEIKIYKTENKVASSKTSK